jgi:hypothetical protein
MSSEILIKELGESTMMMLSVQSYGSVKLNLSFILLYLHLGISPYSSLRLVVQPEMPFEWLLK